MSKLTGSTFAAQDMEFDQATGPDPYGQCRPSATRTIFQQAKGRFEVRILD